MKQLLGAMGLLFAGTAVLIPACADNESSLAIRDVLQPTLDTCEVTADLTSPVFTQGVFDVAIASEYSAFLLVENQLVPRGNQNTLRTETSAIRLYSADVQVQNAGGATLTRSDNSTAQYTVPISGFIDPPLSSTLPSVGITSVLLVDSATAADLAKQTAGGVPMDLVASVIIHGETLGGNEIKTGQWTFPIRACFGCLVTCPPKADSMTIPGHDCEDITEDPKQNCRLGLDTVVDCRLCRGNPACACTK